MTDPIADMLTRIRNAQLVRKLEVRLPYSKIKEQIATILSDEGYLQSVNTDEERGKKVLVLKLKYVAKKPVIQHIKRISKPGRRIYVGTKELPYVFDDLGFAIISTSKGLMTNKQARSAKIGGEIVCEIF